MATFRYKPDKVKYLNVIKTLDETHQEYANDFQKDRKNMKDKISELNLLKEKLNQLALSTTFSDELIHTRASIKDEIKILEQEIENIRYGKDEIEYYSKTSDILMEYYNSLENNDDNNGYINIESENISIKNSSDEKLTQINKISQTHRKVKKPTKNRVKNYEEQNVSKNILTFFMDSSSKLETKSDIKSDDTTNMHKLVSNRASLFENYMNIVDKKYASEKLKIKNAITCTNCNIEKSLNQSEGIYVCKKCGEAEHVIMDSDIPNHKDLGNEKPRTPYKKMTHLSEILNQFQAKESTDIPSAICDTIKQELRKMKVSIEELTEMKYPKAKILIKEILKKLRYTQYYEHIPFILSKITNKPPPTISRETEELLKKLFKLIEAPFMKYCPKDRKNFFNYNFLFHKLFQILEMDEFADCFSLLKSRDKLKLQDNIWEKICGDLGWPFYPSV